MVEVVPRSVTQFQNYYNEIHNGMVFDLRQLGSILLLKFASGTENNENKVYQ
jgi:hypothetical protein